MNKNATRIILGLILLAAVATAIAFRDRFDAAALQAWVEGAGAAGPLLFMLVYALATVLFLPGSVLTLAGGALFGPLWRGAGLPDRALSRRRLGHTPRRLTSGAAE
jgi:uncharacterized membrane protein YdjX (TVP38/TMEM64 family)